jgi:hypothetical protein
VTIRWPERVLIPQNPSFNIAPRSLAGPSSVSGKTQVISSDAGIWKATFGNILVRNRASVLTHRAIATLLEGRLGTILVPRCRDYQPVPEGAIEDGLYDEIEHDDDTLFDDDAGYVGTVIDVVAAAPAAARAVSMTVDVNNAGEIQPGHDFSIGERMYRVRSFDEDTGLLTFRPTLREAVAAGAQLNFDDPVCRMRLASDDAMDLELSLRRFGTPTVQFIEDV